MKRKFLLLIGALVMVLNASAWEKPVPASQPLATDGETEQYLYNVGAEAFMLGANDWNTRASVSTTKGYLWKVEMVDEAGPYYTLTDLCEAKDSKWLRMFTTDANNIWVDNNDGANNATWTILPGEGNLFTIGNEAVEGLLGARAAEKNDTRLYFTSAFPEEELSTEWYSVSKEEYERVIAAIPVYEAAMELKAVLDEAKAKGIDVSAQEAVYNNENSTLEELKAAIEAVKTAINNAAGAGATWAEPIDMTSAIVDPSFETGAMGSWTTQGSGGDCGVKDNSNATYTVNNADGDYVFNTWGRDPLIVTQQLAGMPAGVYSLTALYASDKGNVGQLYAGDEVKNIDAGENKAEGVYGTLVFAHKGGNLEIGMKSSQWFKADNFSLLYHGQGVDALQEYVKGNVPQYDEDEQITTSVLEAYNAAVEAAVENVADVDGAIAVIAELKEAAKAIEENKVAWANFIEKLAQANAILQDESLNQFAEAVLALSDYLMDAEDVVNNKELTTEEINAEIAKLDEMMNAAMQALSDGADFTHVLKNPRMDTKDGWEGNPTINEGCAEKWNSGVFDVYQIVDAQLPVGLYEISLQGFYRDNRGDNAWNMVFEDTEDAQTLKADGPAPLAFVYMNGNKTPLQSVFGYPVAVEYDADTQETTCSYYGNDGYYVDPYHKYAYPNDMRTASIAFGDGAYKMSAFGLVAKEGDKLRVGIKGDLSGDKWAIFDNFQLTYRALNSDVINKLLPEAVAALDLEGKKVGKDVREAVAQALAAADAASSEIEKFNALSQCYDLQEAIENSVKLFNELEIAIANLETAMGKADEVGVAEATKNEAAVLFEKAYAGWDEGTYTDAEAQAALEKIEEMIKALAIPEFLGTDDNPVDMTAFIKDASFDGLSVNGSKYGAWSWTKKEGNGPSFTNAFEFWAGNANNLEFSITQEVTGLPAGKYELKAKAANSYNGQASLENTGRAYLFAETAGETVVPSVAVEPQNDNADVYSEYSVIFTVKAGDVVTVGFKTVGKMDARWFSGDEFELWCYGTESAKEDTSDAISLNPAGIEDVTASETVSVPVAIYNAAGVQTPTLHKGLNIIRMSNGKVRKVMVK